MNKIIKNENVKDGIIFPLGVSNPFQEYFIGNSFLEGLVNDKDIDVNVANVTFEPATRNNWHIHYGYQVLLITGGEGWYQEEGKPAQHLVPGNVIVTKSNIKHWHGATKHSWFSHIAITNGKSKFLNPVSDSEYNQLEGENNG